MLAKLYARAVTAGAGAGYTWHSSWRVAPACAATAQPWLFATFSTDSSESLRNAEKMVEMMSQSPQLQQMMSAAMPASMRNPQMLQQLLTDPHMKSKIAEMIAQRGFVVPPHILERMNNQNMEETFAKAGKLGLNPVELFQKLMAYPGLLSKLKDPHVLQAFLEISSDPANQKKYESEPETLQVVMKVKEILGSQTPSTAELAGKALETPVQQAAGSESEASSSAADTSADASSSTIPEPAINPLVMLMASDPKTADKLNNPRIMNALAEIHKSPWKTVKYVFDREVMEAFKDLKALMAGKKP